ncbi:helix-turn-helix domain-containing protein [Nocardia farcinica]|uniref:helix-turn-helix domain-containing protein n=1 Tax=Nocardia farcinica TaxID=37329 RepID=UPI000C00C8F1|nr:helix-turn-helix transcriptional regulator [Nocardia farcinica]MBA4858317.1 helix-turn-helix transcriptional regulator [Nocardia farcinica]MBC9818086.1 helix-turn-helix transcriptional regulator [Nocardia farcinica]MBF6375284.1 helix-turn-helix transcriptional regulator [Nocardia farcinica]PFX05089.1 Nucleoid-associated protein EspR [Nocardia farcinica]PFX10359.1 Nucleoid-associated protein EspR [Nocardia farcinica]
MTSAQFKSRLNRLIERWEAEHGTTVTNAMLIERMGRAGYSVSPAYLSQLRTGRRANPSPAFLAALAEAMNAPPDYFLYGDAVDGGGDGNSDDGLLGDVRDPKLRGLMRAAAGLSEDSQRLLISLADKLRDAEGRSGGTTAELYP